MKIRLADYVAGFLVKNGIERVFTVTGGGAMHLNDALGHCEGLKCMYNHHEQACAIAAESYARVAGKIAAVCVTTGPGGTNAVTGVMGGWLDSIPMLVISGQVRYDFTVRNSGLPLRQLGDQEFDITKTVSDMTKYCEMVTDKNKIRYCLEKALFFALNGRPGPCWLDIPLNIQSAYIETDELVPYVPSENPEVRPNIVKDCVIDQVCAKLVSAKRPVIYAGSAIKMSGAYEAFLQLVDKLNVPVVLAYNSFDCLPFSHPLYAGRAGINGDRAGNFAVQNSDFLLSLGCRLSVRQVGYDYKNWARAAYTVVVDIDKAELSKPTLHIDLPVCADVFEFIGKMLKKPNLSLKNDGWLDKCRDWVKKYPVVTQKQIDWEDKVNPYYFMKTLSECLPEGQVSVFGNGTACVTSSQTFLVKRAQRIVKNSGCAAMGYDLPAAIGAAVACGRDTVCVTGEGSLQMNIQELQTVVQNKLPVKLFIINNGGYHSIRQTQGNFFGPPLVGIGPESGDLSFPQLERLAWAYGIPYTSCHENQRVESTVKEFIATAGYGICEVFVSQNQRFEPKSASKKLADGRMVSAPLEDMYPFMARDEFLSNMMIEPVNEEF